MAEPTVQHGGLELRFVLRARFRANPQYELAPYSHLGPEQKRRVADLARDPAFYGLLLPRDRPALGVKAVDRDTALLFLTLRNPGPLPHDVIEDPDTDARNRDIVQLVADSILEVEWGKRFLSGAEALSELAFAKTDSSGPVDRIAQLSREALIHVGRLASSEPSTLAARLYCYNTLPLTPRWQRRMGSREAIDALLGLGPRSRGAGTLASAYVEAGPGGEAGNPPADGWRSWALRKPAPPDAGRRCRVKLYLSPHPESLAPVFAATTSVFAEHQVRAFKVGGNAQGLLRPDKFVAYLDDRQHLERVIAALEPLLHDVQAQGVPFTASLRPDGLLSWGSDPPREQPLRGGDAASWRFWLVDRLARAIVSAREDPESAAEPWRHAVERLRLEGVDTGSWTPSDDIWEEER